MPLSKTDLFKPKDVRVAAMAKALAHPARVAILRELARQNECVCGEIVSAIPLAQATVSQHLKELKTAGLIKGEADGPRSCYCLDPDGIQLLMDTLDGLLGQMEACCGVPAPKTQTAKSKKTASGKKTTSNSS
ncbi:MAG: metalloregulator ArsR/SmtB family transcription factor [Bacteroidetes bacterium]|jgi:DNA-binding transcriptional ArsR family regulator|nr:metalloregulator ArsR/SmtB family transcription factor [Bacteroidota bacterium]